MPDLSAQVQQITDDSPWAKHRIDQLEEQLAATEQERDALREALENIATRLFVDYSHKATADAYGIAEAALAPTEDTSDA